MVIFIGAGIHVTLMNIFSRTFGNDASRTAVSLWPNAILQIVPSGTTRHGTTSATESETVLADLQLSRSLTIQWAVVGTMAFAVAIGAFSALYRLTTGQTATYDFAPAGAARWTDR